MNREYHDGAEPDSLPHYAHCSGPCQQGRAPCPCPVACEREASDLDISILGLLVCLVIITLAIVGLGAIVEYYL